MGFIKFACDFFRRLTAFIMFRFLDGSFRFFIVLFEEARRLQASQHKLMLDSPRQKKSEGLPASSQIAKVTLIFCSSAVYLFVL